MEQYVDRFGFERSKEMYFARFAVFMFIFGILIAFGLTPSWLFLFPGMWYKLGAVCFVGAQFSFNLPFFKRFIDLIK